MRAFVIIAIHPGVQVRLQVFEFRVDALAERDLVELLFDRPVEPFADPVSLRTVRLRFGVVDVVDRQEQLIEGVLLIETRL